MLLLVNNLNVVKADVKKDPLVFSGAILAILNIVLEGWSGGKFSIYLFIGIVCPTVLHISEIKEYTLVKFWYSGCSLLSKTTLMIAPAITDISPSLHIFSIFVSSFPTKLWVISQVYSSAFLKSPLFTASMTGCKKLYLVLFVGFLKSKVIIL